jgi:hypothetical protein
MNRRRWQCLNLAVAAVCDRRKTALIERRYNSNFEIKTLLLRFHH